MSAYTFTPAGSPVRAFIAEPRVCPDAPLRRPLREESPAPHALFEPAPRAPPAGDRLGRISPAYAAENAAFGAAILYRPIARIAGRPHTGRNGGEGGYPRALSAAAVAARAAVHVVKHVVVKEEEEETPSSAKKPRI